MSDRDIHLRRAYEPPRVADYGTLAELTADAGMLMPLGLSQLSGPVIPPSDTDTPGGPDIPGSASGSSHGGFAGTVPEVLPEGGGLGSGGPGAEAPGGSTPAGAGAEGGGGGTVSTGGGDASLPFTGFPAAVAAAVGAGLAGAGAALRRRLRRDKTDR
jgi:hypothetical protein